MKSNIVSISDLAMHKFLDFCTRHLCEVVFLKLIKSVLDPTFGCFY